MTTAISTSHNGSAASAPSAPRLERNFPLYFVQNEASGRDDPEQTRQAIEEVLGRVGREFEFLTNTHGGALDSVAQRAVTLAGERGGVVVAVGGDGTINTVAQAALGARCVMGVLPQGTFNYFGRTWSIPEEPVGALHALLAGTVRAVQVGMLNSHVFLVNASVGLYPQLLADRETWKKRFGRSRVVAAWAALTSLLQGHLMLTLTVEHGGEAETVRTPTLFVGNNRLQLEQIGVQQSSVVQSGKLVAIMPRVNGTLALLWLALRGAFGRLGDADQIDTLAFRELTVTPRRRALSSRRIRASVDGEIIRVAAPLEFRPAPDPLWVMLPADADAPSA